MEEILNSFSELGVGSILASGIHIPNLLTNYPMKLHEIKNYVHEYYSRTYLPTLRCIIIIGLEVISHFRNKHTYFSKWMKQNRYQRKLICNSDRQYVNVIFGFPKQ